MVFCSADSVSMAGAECLFIDQHTRLREFKQQLR
jgi:hypothetical protein